MEVKIYLNDLKYRYEVYQLFNVYFSMSNIDFIEEDKSDYKVYVYDETLKFEYKDYNMTENLKDIVGNEYDDSLIDTAKAISDITKNYIKNGGSEE